MPLDTTEIDNALAETLTLRATLATKMSNAATVKRQDKTQIDNYNKKISHLRTAKRQMREADKL